MNPASIGNGLWLLFRGIALLLVGGYQLFNVASALLGGGDKSRGAKRLVQMGQNVARLTGKN